MQFRVHRVENKLNLFHILFEIQFSWLIIKLQKHSMSIKIKKTPKMYC